MGLLGCAPALTVQEISVKTTDTSTKVTSVKMDMNMNTTFDITGGSQAGKMTMVENASVQVDIPSQEMSMSVDATANIPGQGNQSFTTDMYITGGWVYMKMPTVTGSEQWVKVKLDELAWDQQNQLAQQVNFLKTALNITKLDDEKISGVDCYVIQVNPDMTVLMGWVAQQDQSNSELKDINPGMFKSTSIKEWIAKDSMLPIKSYMNMVIEMTPADINAGTATSTSPGFDKMIITMGGTVNFSDYNKPVNIELPQAAAGAQEITNPGQTGSP